MRQFEVALKQHGSGPFAEAEFEFEVEDPPESGQFHQLKAYPPEASQMAVLMAGLGRHVRTENKIAAVIDFFVEVMDDDSAAYIRSRLLDRRDAFGLEEVEQIMSAMVEEWTGRPTQPPSASTRSGQNGGRSSKRSISKQTSSVSASTDT